MARIQRIVRDLGSFSHADEDVNVPISVNTAVESALTMLRNELKYRARVEQDLRASRPVLASAPRLGQVFLNLISNAVQALEEANVKRNLVRVRSFDDGEYVVVEVSDNGPGHRARGGAADLRVVLHHQAARDGDRARPADLARDRAQPGRRDHRRQPAGRGRDLPRAHPRHRRGARRRGRRCRTRRRPRFARRRILAVDDEALLLKAYRRMLCDAHELTTALGGHEALKVLENDARFDVVLCDLQMPEMSGMELHAAVMERYPALANRFVFVTGGAFSGDARRFLEESVPAVIQKPFNVDDLLRLVDTIGSGGGKRVEGAAPRRSRRQRDADQVDAGAQAGRRGARARGRGAS